MLKTRGNVLVQLLNGTSQVFFVENALTGLFFFAAMAYASYITGVWATTIGAAVGIVVATLTAKLLECDGESVSSGLFGFNGVLLGAALPTFIAASPQLWVYVVVGAAASTVFTAAFTATLTSKWDIPGSTGPFVLTGWLMVAGAYSFGGLKVTGDAPKLASDYVHGLVAIPSPMELVEIIFRNIGQVYLLGSAVSGAIVLVGIFIASVPAGIAAIAGIANRHGRVHRDGCRSGAGEAGSLRVQPGSDGNGGRRHLLEARAESGRLHRARHGDDRVRSGSARRHGGAGGDTVLHRPLRADDVSIHRAEKADGAPSAQASGRPYGRRTGRKGTCEFGRHRTLRATQDVLVRTPCVGRDAVRAKAPIDRAICE